MIIDFHSHIWKREWRPESMWDSLADTLIQRMGMKDGGSRESVKSEIFSEFLDPTGERHLLQMEEAGIDITVLHPLDYGLAPPGEAPTTIEEQNAFHARLVKKHPDKFLAFGGVDPRRPHALELVKKGLEEWGFRGIKLHPTAGFYPDDPAVDGIYRKACELDVPVLLHTGHMAPPLDDRYTHPSRLKAVTERYPDLKIVAAHMAYDWWDELEQVGRKNTNLYTDISGWQFSVAAGEGSLPGVLRTMLDILGEDRVMFGTDGIIFNKALVAGKWIEYIRELPENRGSDTIISKEEAEGVLGLNARKLLAL